MSPTEGWEVSHICMAVDDLPRWMEIYGKLLGGRWTSVLEVEDEVSAPADPGGTRRLRGRAAWASAHRPWLELFEGAPGSPWHQPEGARIDHIGYWSDDLDRSAQTLIDAGYELELTIPTDTPGLLGMAYMRHPTGLRVEIHTSADKEVFDGWVYRGEPLNLTWGPSAP